MNQPNSNLRSVTLYTDGACSGNPGPGGWGAVLIYGDHEKQLSGFESETTNNRMEMQAAIEGLKALTSQCQVALYTDSTYVMKGITEWMKGWKAKGWKTAAGKPVKNKDLWIELEAQCARHQLEWHWVKGHAGDHYNEMADTLAVNACKAQGAAA